MEAKMRKISYRILNRAVDLGDVVRNKTAQLKSAVREIVPKVATVAALVELGAYSVPKALAVPGTLAAQTQTVNDPTFLIGGLGLSAFAFGASMFFVVAGRKGWIDL